MLTPSDVPSRRRTAPRARPRQLGQLIDDRPGYDPQVSEGGDGQVWTTRPMRAGAFTFLVGTPEVQVKDSVEAMFRDLPTAELVEGEMELFMLVPTEVAGGSRWQLTGPGVGALSGMSLADALAMLVTGVNLSALDAEPQRLHLHAGAAVRDGRAVVMSAPRETGKTTTLARLVLRGWDFISDEAVSISGTDDEVRGFAKPLSIKPPGRSRVPELMAHMVPALDDVEAQEIVHVPLGAVGAMARDRAEPGLVVLLRRSDQTEPGGPPASLPVHPADAVVHLMGETMDAGRFGPRAVLELARLTARCSCHEVLVGDPEATAELIEELFDVPQPEPLPIRVLEGGAAIATNVVSLLVGDRVVIHEQPEGRILALDAMGSQIWLQLGGWETSPDIDLFGPVVAPFVHQLTELGLVQQRSPGDAQSGGPT